MPDVQQGGEGIEVVHQLGLHAGGPQQRRLLLVQRLRPRPVPRLRFHLII